jgi:branched-chain amino acid transport system permease protein
MGAFAGAGVLMMVLLGGMGSLWGPLLGAAVFIFMQDYISTMTEHWEFFVGLVVILLVLFMPGGLAGFYGILTKPRGE